MKLNFNQKKPKHEKKVSDKDVEMEDPTSDQEQNSDKAKKPVPPSKVSFWLLLDINRLKYPLHCYSPNVRSLAALITNCDNLETHHLPPLSLR